MRQDARHVTDIPKSTVRWIENGPDLAITRIHSSFITLAGRKPNKTDIRRVTSGISPFVFHNTCVSI